MISKENCNHPVRFREYYREGCFKCYDCHKIIVEPQNITDENNLHGANNHTDCSSKSTNGTGTNQIWPSKAIEWIKLFSNRTKRRIMKKLILILLVAFVMVSCGQPSKYRIDTPSGSFQTNSYQEIDGCVVFKNECGCGGEAKSTKVCGNYTIIKSNQNGQ